MKNPFDEGEFREDRVLRIADRIIWSLVAALVLVVLGMIGLMAFYMFGDMIRGEYKLGLVPHLEVLWG